MLHLELDAPGLAHDPKLEVLVCVEDEPRVVDHRAGIQHGERAAPEQRVEAALAAVEELVDLLLGQVVEDALRRDARMHDRREVEARVAAHGRISIGVPAPVSSQKSSMSSFDSAMQPSVQSVLR
jgi:hypothetical protein